MQPRGHGLTAHLPLFAQVNIFMFIQGRRNGFEHGGDSEPPVAFEPFIVQTSNLQFWKW